MSVAVDSALDAGVRIRFHRAPTAAAEAEFITHETEKWLGGAGFFSVDSARVTGHGPASDVGLGDIAVLVRLRALIEPIAKALTRLGLPVQIAGDRPFVERPDARKVIEALRGLPAEAHARPAAEALKAPALSKLGATEAWRECARLADAFPGALREFLDHLLLRQGADSYSDRAERIAVLTLHAAKGLEFPVVFLAGCEEGIVPYARPGETPDIDEERRLLYVGMTRARQVLYITSARRRSLFGKSERRPPSPFVQEIEETLRVNLAPRRRRKRPAGKQLDLGF